METKLKRNIKFDVFVLWPVLILAFLNWPLGFLFELLINSIGVFLILIFAIYFHVFEKVHDDFKLKDINTNNYMQYMIGSTVVEVLFMSYAGWYWTALGWTLTLLLVCSRQYYGKEALYYKGLIKRL